MINLAATLIELGRHQEGKLVEIEAVHLHKAALGPNHPLTIQGMANLPVTLHSCGKYTGSEELGDK